MCRLTINRFDFCVRLMLFLKINTSITFSYSQPIVLIVVIYLLFNIFFKVNAQFTTVYQNFTNRQSYDVCISYNTATFPNLQIIRTLFDGVTCGNLSLSNTINKNLFVSDTLEYCNDNMEIHNVTTEPGKFELFCGKANCITFTHP